MNVNKGKENRVVDIVLVNEVAEEWPTASMDSCQRGLILMPVTGFEQVNNGSAQKHAGDKITCGLVIHCSSAKDMCQLSGSG